MIAYQYSWSPLPYNYVFLRRLGSLNRWRIWYFDPPYNPIAGFSKNVSTAHWQSAIRHPTLIVFIGLTWTWSLSSLTVPALSRILYLGMCFSQQSIIFHQDNMKLMWFWTIHHVHDQPKKTFHNLTKSHIKPSLTHWIPFNGFHSRIMKPWLQKIYGSKLPNGLYNILYIGDPTLDSYSIIHFCWKNQWIMCPCGISSKIA